LFLHPVNMTGCEDSPIKRRRINFTCNTTN
jgi:hypothetical protein